MTSQISRIHLVNDDGTIPRDVAKTSIMKEENWVVNHPLVDVVVVVAKLILKHGRWSSNVGTIDYVMRLGLTPRSIKKAKHLIVNCNRRRRWKSRRSENWSRKQSGRRTGRRYVRSGGRTR
jgi:hypothetical protein